MTDADTLQRLADEAEIRRVRNVWALSRDLGEYDTMKSCFHPDAELTVSWYSGNAWEFVEATKKLSANRKPEERSKHWFGNWRSWLKGDRAILETDVQVITRDRLDGCLFDYISYSRFFDLFERRDGEWKIWRWWCVYDKDNMTPTIPGSAPPSFFDGIDFSQADNGFAFMKLRQAKRGGKIPPGIIIGQSPDEARIRKDGFAWLEGKS